MADIDQVDAMLDESLKEQTKAADTNSSLEAKKQEQENGDKEHSPRERSPRENGDRKDERHSRSRSGSRRRSSSRDRRRSRSPRRRSRSPRRRSRSPRRRSRSPRRRSRSPRRRRSRSPRHRRRYSRSPRRHRRSPRRHRRSRSRSPRRRSPSPRLPQEERDARTVVCLQLHRNCTERDLKEFLEEGAGKVRSCKLISDRNSRRTKGIAYAEFYEKESVPKALTLVGKRLLGAPIQIMLTQAEKNRIAEEKAKREQLAMSRIAVSNLPPQITEAEHLRMLFESFGKLRDCSIDKDEDGKPKNSGIVLFESPKFAQLAIEGMNNREIMDHTLHVSLASQASVTTTVVAPAIAQQQVVKPVQSLIDAAPSKLDREEMDKAGVALTATDRATLMQKLAASRGMAAPGAPVPPVAAPPVPAPPAVPGAPAAMGMPAPAAMGMPAPAAAPTPVPGLSIIPTAQLVLRNMFDPTTETEQGWDKELRDEVLEECSKQGPVLHILVDSQDPKGSIYVRFAEPAACMRAHKMLNGRFFDKRTVEAYFITEAAYIAKCPDAANATTPIQPSS